MMELAGRERDFARYDSLASLLARRRSVPHPFVARALTAIGSGSEDQRAKVLAEVRGADAADAMPAWAVAKFTEDLDAARSIAVASLRRAPTPREAAQLHYVIAAVELASGRREAGSAAFAAAVSAGTRANSPGSVRLGRQMQVFAAVFPFLVVAPAAGSEVRTAVQQWRSSADSASSANDLPAALHAHMRLYLLGLLAVRQGAYEDALLLAGELERLPPIPGAEPVVLTLLRGVRASAALGGGDAATALTVLGTTNEVIPPIYAGEFGFAEVHARWVRAEALFTLRRDDEALHWYALTLESPVANGALLELALAAPSHLRRAEIYERRGDATKAAEHYRRFQAMWKVADPPMRALANDAGARGLRLSPAR